MREKTINPQSGLYAILGDPISHSMSPVIMNSSFDRLGMDNVFLALKATPRCGPHWKAAITKSPLINRERLFAFFYLMRSSLTLQRHCASFPALKWRLSYHSPEKEKGRTGFCDSVRPSQYTAVQQQFFFVQVR